MADAQNVLFLTQRHSVLGSMDVSGTNPSYKRLVRLARRGQGNPRSLTAQEIEQLCTALLDHYAQMGIG